MPPGSKLQTPDGIVGIVLANNNVQLQIPPNFQQRLLLQRKYLFVLFYIKFYHIRKLTVFFLIIIII